MSNLLRMWKGRRTFSSLAEFLTLSKSSDKLRRFCLSKMILKRLSPVGCYWLPRCFFAAGSLCNWYCSVIFIKINETTCWNDSSNFSAGICKWLPGGLRSLRSNSDDLLPLLEQLQPETIGRHVRVCADLYQLLRCVQRSRLQLFKVPDHLQCDEPSLHPGCFGLPPIFSQRQLPGVWLRNQHA